MDTIEWCGYTWRGDMNGRLIHPDYPWYWYSLDAVKSDKSNILELFVRKNPKDIKHWDGKTYHPQYEVATMRSMEEFGYGTFSCEMMMPVGKNITASFWLSGSGNWPPEIDIEEGLPEDKQDWFRMNKPRFPWIYPGWCTTTNVHFRNEKMQHDKLESKNISWFKQSKDPSEYFIEYKCKWEPDKITFYANGKVVRKITGNVCRQLTQNIEKPEKGWKMNVIFNTWCKNPDTCRVEMITPMLIKNFKYEPL